MELEIAKKLSAEEFEKKQLKEAGLVCDLADPNVSSAKACFPCRAEKSVVLQNLPGPIKALLSMGK